MPCAANTVATENDQCCNQATCAQITDGISVDSFSCAGSTGLHVILILGLSCRNYTCLIDGKKMQIYCV